MNMLKTTKKRKKPSGWRERIFEKKTLKFKILRNFNMLVAMRRVHIFTSCPDDDLCGINGTVEPPPQMNTSKTTKKRKKCLISAYFEYKNVFYIQGFYVRKPIDNIYM